MIELLLADRCIGCGACVAVCPANVFDGIGEGATPSIARQSDCQTCFLCELYCKADALYVAPDCHAPSSPDPAEIVASGTLGQYRKDSGWHEYADDPALQEQHWRMEEVFLRAAAHQPEGSVRPISRQHPRRSAFLCPSHATWFAIWRQTLSRSTAR